jgi:hypothetical protein
MLATKQKLILKNTILTLTSKKGMDNLVGLATESFEFFSQTTPLPLWLRKKITLDVFPSLA